MGDYGQYVVPTSEEMINFKVGQPATSMLPLELISKCCADKFAKEKDPMYLQYGHIMGYPKFRKSLASFLVKRYNNAVSVDSEELFVTNGVTGGLALISTLFAKSGDLVFLEEPSYFLALSIMKDFNLTVRQIPMEEDGINVVLLEQLLEQGIVPKFLYTVPTCHNPTGRTMSVAKRAKLVELSSKYGFLIVADEVYQLLSFPHVTPPPPMATFDKHGTVLALGSFSKILAPALRLGWIHIKSPELMQKIISCGQLDSSGGVNPVISGIVHSAIELGIQDQHLQETKNVLWERADALMKALDEHLPEGVSFERPNGGYFILVKLPSEMKAAKLLEIAQANHKVMFLPGSAFAETMKNYLRLSFSWYSYDDLAVGAKRLAEAIREYSLQLKNESSSVELAKTKSGPLSVAVHGENGRLGALIVAQLKERSGEFQYVGGLNVRELTCEKFEQFVSTVDVIIDVTLPEGTSKLCEYLLSGAKSGKHCPRLVVGTTGTALPLEGLTDYSHYSSVALKSNFSIGVPLVNNVLQSVAHQLSDNSEWNVSISETHHIWKKDAPSGTATTFQKTISSVGGIFEDVENVPCVSMRLGDELGQHTISFAGPGERIEIKHQATRREVFAIGAVRSAEWICKQPKGLFH